MKKDIKKEKAVAAEHKNENDEIIEKTVPEDESAVETADEAESIAGSKQYDDLLDKYQRLFAEFDNYRKRSIKERGQANDDGVRSTVLVLLPVFDNLERAVSSSKDIEDPLYKGIEMTMKTLKQVLDSLGVKAIPAVGEKFNPDLHDAVIHEDSEEHGENEVVMEMQKGYMYKDKVIRHSMVKVVN